MLQRGIGVTVGAIITYVLLWLLVGGDSLQDYAIAVILGGLAAFFWPIVIAWWLARRARQRSQGRIESEVQRQLDEERRRGG